MKIASKTLKINYIACLLFLIPYPAHVLGMVEMFVNFLFSHAHLIVWAELSGIYSATKMVVSDIGCSIEQLEFQLNAYGVMAKVHTV